ncbi:hypothetical protein KI387_043941 [Taxus chinensis]|uniref:Protein kinase domain-containing protein n=1 Tax=Taxus chinensis TaxID=29808 RepID=A0AA38LFQ3_TAXCH|nr:hypothetical protein KI387_043941 [Taxus chinensis]
MDKGFGPPIHMEWESPLSICGGDLKLIDVNNGSIWELFSYPTNTLIPGKSLEIDMKLTSNKSSTDLSKGSYSLMVENCGIALYYNNPPMPTPLPYWVWTLNKTNNTVGVQDPGCNFGGLLMSPTTFKLTSFAPKCALNTINNSINYTGYNEILFQKFGSVDPDPYTYLKLESDGVLRAVSLTSGWSNVFELDKCRQDPCFVPSAYISYEKEFNDYHPTRHFRRFSSKELDRATEGFCTKVREGKLGTMFLGCVEGDGKIVVKRVECSKNGKKSFQTEIEILGNIQHMNLVHLLGFCAEGNEILLVYE